MSANYRNPNFLLPNELNQSINPDLSVDRHSLYSTEFNGSSSYIDCGNNSSINIGGDLTISAWVYVYAHKNYNGIISKIDATNRNYEILVRNTANISFYTNNGNGGSIELTSSTTTIATNTWTHVAVVVNSSVSNGTKFYFNGVQDATTGTHTVVGQTNDLYIGRRSTGLYNFNGKIDEVAIWNSALSLEQIQALADSKNSPVNIMALDPKPRAYYPLGEEARNTGYLSSGSDVSGSEWQFPNQVVQSTNFNFVYDSGLTPDLDTGYALNGTDWSFSYWVNFGGGSGTIVNNPKQIISNKDGSTGFYLQQGFSSQQLFFNGTFTPNQSQNGKYINTYNKWYHVVITHDSSVGSYGETKTYVSDSVEKVVGTKTNTLALAASSANITIGPFMRSNSTETKVANVQFWDVALSSTDVDTITSSFSPYTGTQPQANNLQFWYKLNAENVVYNSSNSTWTLNDSSGNNRNISSNQLVTSSLVRTDLQFESPYSNFSLNLDGTNSVYFPNPGTFTGDISMSVWLNVDTNGTQDGILSSKNYTNANSFSMQNRNGVINFILYHSTGYLISNFNPSPALINNWNNIVVSFNTSDSKIRIYFNNVIGTTIDTSSYPNTNMSDIANGLALSGWSSSGVFPPTSALMDAKVDELSIFNKALNQSEVSQIYNNGLASDLTSLSPSNWWRLGEDAYFVNNVVTVPNQIIGGTSGTSSGTQTSMLVADAPGSYASGSGVNLDIVDRVGEAPGELPDNVGNSQSYNMTPSSRISAPKPFIMEIITTGTNESFRLYSAGNNGTPYKILWGDGSSEINSNNDVTHTYSLAGTYEITIPEPYNKSSFPTITGNRSKISKIKQWGTLNWINLLSSWQYLPNFSITATDKANFSNVTSFSGAFRNSSMTNLGLYKDWVSSNCNNLGLMFYQTSLIGDFDFSSWDTSNVTNLSYFIGNSSNITSIDTTGWDTSNVTSLLQFAVNCTNLTKIIGHENWDVSAVTSFDNFIYNSIKIEEFDPSSWDVSSATTFSRAFMYAFKGLTNPSLDLSSWNTSSVTTFSQTFRLNDTITSLGNINNWDVSNVTNMGYMFNGCTSLNLPNLSSWNMSSVTNILSMFQSTSGSSGSGIENWDTSSVTNASNCFYASVDVFNFTSLNWDLRNCSTISMTFRNCRFSNSNLTLNIQTDSTLTNCSQFIRGSSGIDTLVLGNNVDFSGVTNFFYAFQGLGNLSLTIPSTLSFASATNFSNFLTSTTLSSADYNALLVRIEATNQINNINFMGGNNVATGAGLTARTALINDHSWTISDGT